MSATIGIEYYEVYISDEQKLAFSQALGVPASEVRGQHVYLVYTNSAGAEFVLEGGPATQPPGPTTPIATVAGDPLVRNPVGVGEAGLQTKEGRKYSEISLDGDVTALWEIMKAHAQAIENAGVTYTFFPGPNSNSVVASALNAIGVNLLDVVQEPLKSRSAEITGSTNTITSVTPATNLQNGSVGADTITTTAGLDIVRAQDGDDTIIWTAGGDVVNGGAGRDTWSIARSYSAGEVAVSENGSRVVMTVDGQVSTGTDLEIVRFTNGALRLDIEESEIAGSSYRLYQAAFNRTPDQGGLAYWIDRRDDGTSLKEVANSFLGSNEFSQTYGVAPSDATYVTLLYNNVLRRAPDQGGLDFWLSQLGSATIDRGDVLVNFSESAENVALVAPSIADGIFIA